MATFEYNIEDLYSRAFGPVGRPFPNLSFEADGNRVQQVKNKGGSFASTINQLGGDIFMPLKLDGFQLPGEALITVGGGKSLVQTDLSGTDGKRLGVVTELTGRKPFRLRIRGVLVSNVNNYLLSNVPGADLEQFGGTLSNVTPTLNANNVDVYPAREVKRLSDICQKPGTVTIENKLTSILGITTIIIEDFGFPGIPGVEEAEAFEIQAYSEESIEAQILQL